MLSAELHTTLLMFVAEVQCLCKGPQVRTDEMVRIWAKFYSIGLILIEGKTQSAVQENSWQHGVSALVML